MLAGAGDVDPDERARWIEHLAALGRGERRAGAARRRPPRAGAGVSAAIVTGAAGAIGRAVARRLLEDDLAVVCVDRDAAVADVCRELGDGAVPCVADLAAPDAPERVLAAAAAPGGAAVLVNNAGITRDGARADDDARGLRARRPGQPRRAAAARRGGRPAPRRRRQRREHRARAPALGNFGQANYVTAKSGPDRARPARSRCAGRRACASTRSRRASSTRR